MSKTKQLFISMLTLLCCCTGAWAQSSDVLSGEFTINASGDKVHFSKGNLQKVDGNYQFAEHQYEYFGTTQSANHCDLFAFNNYQTPDGDVLWRILSKDEWGYLITERSVNNTLSEGALYSKATIGGVYKGVIVFPDNYTHPEGTGFSGSCNNGTANYTSTVSLEGWAKMEAAGCVFLPAAGYGYGYNDIRDVNSSCFYESSTKMDSNHRYTPGFYSNNSALNDNSVTSTLIPVRYVQLIINIQRDEDGYWLIGSVQDWKDFADLIKISPNINAKMTAGIDLGNDQTKIGTNSAPYQGIFDGQGHTLTVNWTTTGDYCAPFPYINGATFKNLHVTGTINTSHRFTGSLVGKSIGTSYINNCCSSVEMISSYNGDAVRGGFAATVEGGSLNFNDCVFDGTFTGASSQTWGGFVGWKYSGSVNIVNGLFVPKSVNVSATYSATFSGNGGTVKNSYYTVQINNSNQGTLASAEQLADGSIAYKLQASRADLVWGQRIGIDTEPVLTNNESYRVYRSKNGGYTNNPAEAYEGLQQDADGNYLLGCVWDWREFAVIVNNGTNPAANAKMTADIDLGDDQTHIGSVTQDQGSYKGIFDGNGHTLTVAYNGSRKQIVAPFTQVDGATIKNLHVNGSISSVFAFIGVVGYVTGNHQSKVSNVWMSANMKCSTGEWAQSGTIVGGLAGTSTSVVVTDCLFTGSFECNMNSYCGCFIGYNYQSSSATASNCLSLGTLNISGTGGRVTNSNCYIKQLSGSVPTDMQVTDEQLADGTITAKLQAGREEEVWVQDPLTNQPMLKVFMTNGIKGDVNGDGIVDVADIASVIDCMSGNGKVSKERADVNGDGRVDVADIAAIIDIMAGK